LADFFGARAAINARDSNTGMNLFRAAIAPLAHGRAFFSAVVVTGAHALSLAAVAEGTADIAAIDCVSFALLRRGRAEPVERVEVLQRTPSSPGLPFIASAALAPEALATIRRCLFETLADARLAEDFAALGLTGAEVLEPQAYEHTSELEEAAIALGYPELA
jgi:ABC-type phosphate/phosphonate transport system substrate-binding protein